MEIADTNKSGNTSRILSICSILAIHYLLSNASSTFTRNTAFVGYSEGPIKFTQQRSVTHSEVMVFSTHYGDIRVVLRQDAAPKTVEYMKNLAREGLFDGCSFYRAEPSGETVDQGRNGTRRGYALVQGGLYSCGRQQSIVLPTEPVLGNNVGTVALITGTSEFFFNLEEHHEWDKSFNVWGTIINFICGDECLRISPDQPYFLKHPIRRGHLNISQIYSMQQISEDLYLIWDWILREKLRISPKNRHMFSAILVLSETFDNHEIKELLSVVLRDLEFNSAVIHQESIAATFGNGVSSACVVNIGAQSVSIFCIEDGVALPTTGVTLPFGGEDISRCLLWVEQRRQTWPPIDTDPMVKPIDLLMLNRLKETYCKFKEGDSNAPADVHYYKASLPPDIYRVALSALNVPPMGLFYPFILMPDEYPRPPHPWFHDYEDMMEEGSHGEFGRRPDGAEVLFSGCNYLLGMQDPSQSSPKLKKEDNLVGLAEAITNSILATGRLDLYRKLFTSVLLVGGVASTKGLVDAVEQRILSAIPDHVDVEMVEVLQLRTDPLTIAWKGGAVLGILDFGRDAWIQRENWVRGGIHIGSGQKYKDSYLFQTQTLWYINN